MTSRQRAWQHAMTAKGCCPQCGCHRSAVDRAVNGKLCPTCAEKAKLARRKYYANLSPEKKAEIREKDKLRLREKRKKEKA